VPIRSVAIICNEGARNRDIAIQSRRALGKLLEVEQYQPIELPSLERTFGLYLFFDDGLRYRSPASRHHPSAWWVIDPLPDVQSCAQHAASFDFVLAAQYEQVCGLRRSGIRAEWLPLACDTDFHRPGRGERVHDLCVLGNPTAPSEVDLWRRLATRYPRSLFARPDLEATRSAYSAARIAVEAAASGVVSRHVFRALASGCLLLSNDEGGYPQARLLEKGKDYLTFRGADDLIRQIDFYLEHPDLREGIAAAGRSTVLTAHSYEHRMVALLERVGS
jgi:hypothetical protein